MFLISCSIQVLSVQFGCVDADPVFGMRPFVDARSDETCDDNDPYDPATANWRYAKLHT